MAKVMGFFELLRKFWELLKNTVSSRLNIEITIRFLEKSQNDTFLEKLGFYWFYETFTPCAVFCLLCHKKDSY